MWRKVHRPGNFGMAATKTGEHRSRGQRFPRTWSFCIDETGEDSAWALWATQKCFQRVGKLRHSPSSRNFRARCSAGRYCERIDDPYQVRSEEVRWFTVSSWLISISTHLRNFFQRSVMGTLRLISQQITQVETLAADGGIPYQVTVNPCMPLWPLSFSFRIFHFE